MHHCGVHTVRYNSLIRVNPLTARELSNEHCKEMIESGDLCLYSMGNRLCAYNLKTCSTVFERKLFEEVVLVVKQTSVPSDSDSINHFIACTYDASFVVFRLVENEGRLDIVIEKRVSELCEVYRYTRQAQVFVSQEAYHIAFVAEVGDYEEAKKWTDHEKK